MKERRRTEGAESSVSIQEGWLKDLLLRYVKFYPQAFLHLEVNVDHWIYPSGKFCAFTFHEMHEWFEAHKRFTQDPQLGMADERKKALDAYHAVPQWLKMDNKDITSLTMQRFKRYIIDKEKVTATQPTSATQTTPSYPSTSATAVPVPKQALAASKSTTEEFEGFSDDDEAFFHIDAGTCNYICSTYYYFVYFKLVLPFVIVHLDVFEKDSFV
jgi:hypothetical protein